MENIIDRKLTGNEQRAMNIESLLKELRNSQKQNCLNLSDTQVSDQLIQFTVNFRENL